MFEMRETGATLEEISKKFKLSAERVRQIITREPNFCIKHSRSFSNRCEYCVLEETYKKGLSDCDIEQVLYLSKRISPTGRAMKEIIQRRLITRLLRDKYKQSFGAIGRLLKRDHTSIMNLYYNG